MPGPAPLVPTASKQRCFTDFKPPVSLLLLGNHCSSASPLCPLLPVPLQAVVLMDARSPLACRLIAACWSSAASLLGFLSSPLRCSTGCCCCLSAALLAVLGHHSCTAVSLFSTDRFTAVALHGESHFPKSTSFLQCHLLCVAVHTAQLAARSVLTLHISIVGLSPPGPVPLCHSNRPLQSSIAQTPAVQPCFTCCLFCGA